MSELAPQIWHAIFTSDTYEVVAQQLPTISQDLHKWAGLHIMSHYLESASNFWFIKEANGYKFCLLIFELDTRSLEYFDETGGDEVQNPTLYNFNTEDELYAVCKIQDIDPEKFGPPWRSKYPFG